MNCHSLSRYSPSLLTCHSGTECLDRQVRSVSDVSLVNAPQCLVRVAVTESSWCTARVRLTTGAHHCQRTTHKAP